MEGTGGVRKLRWGRGSQGKSGGVRVIYYFHDELMPLYLLTLFAKGDRTNLSKAERNDLAGLVDVLVGLWKRERTVQMNHAYESIKRGLQEAIAHAQGQSEEGSMSTALRPVDVKALRAKVNMTQKEEFAAKFGFSTATLRHWERGDRQPVGASLVLLNVIERNPRAVIKALTA